MKKRLLILLVLVVTALACTATAMATNVQCNTSTADLDNGSYFYQHQGWDNNSWADTDTELDATPYKQSNGDITNGHIAIWDGVQNVIYDHNGYPAQLEWVQIGLAKGDIGPYSWGTTWHKYFESMHFDGTNAGCPDGSDPHDDANWLYAPNASPCLDYQLTDLGSTTGISLVTKVKQHNSDPACWDGYYGAFSATTLANGSCIGFVSSPDVAQIQVEEMYPDSYNGDCADVWDRFIDTAPLTFQNALIPPSYLWVPTDSRWTKDHSGISSTDPLIDEDNTYHESAHVFYVYTPGYPH